MESYPRDAGMEFMDMGKSVGQIFHAHIFIFED